MQDQWNGGFVAAVTVTAGTTALTGWRVTLNLPSGASVSSVWNGVANGTSGTITVASQSYNGRLGAGQSTSFGSRAAETAAAPPPPAPEAEAHPILTNDQAARRASAGAPAPARPRGRGQDPGPDQGL
ncbi:cellulose binding domain-containing protein [Micromonospora sp. NPDC049230]|uniref:cellulose binding domain-containing protein n=1 Tax=Micromonospora sp. NPDC049230 TaxID=3155502 RepID=UPI0033DC41E7